MTGIEKAVKIAGNANKLAKLLGTDRQLIDYWISKGEPSPDYCIAIQRHIGVPLHELRPKTYPPETENKAAQASDLTA